MANRKNTFLLKRSNVSGKVPLPNDLQLGELALNTADVILYTSGTTQNDIIPIGWDRIHRTGDTVTGDFNFYGDFVISGNSQPNGYALSVTGDTNLYGNTIIQSGLTANTIYTNYIDFNTLYVPTVQEGRLHWDSTYGTLDVDLEGNNLSLKVGLDNLYYIKNQSGVTINKGRVVRSAGTIGGSGRILGEYMIANGTIPYYFTLGISGENILDGQDGYVYEFGLVKGVNTTGSLYGETWVDGTILYVSPTITGGLTNIEPTEPNLKIQIAIVINAATNGSLFVRPSLGYNLGDLHNVQTSGQTNGDLISYNTSQGYWEYTKILNGNYTISGDTNFLGDLNISGNTEQYGNVYISGTSLPNECALYVDGNTCLNGDVQVIGNLSYQGDLNVTGNTSLIGDTFISGSSLSSECALYVNGNVCIDGDVTISGDTFMSGDFCMNNMNSTGQTGTNCFDTSLIPTGDTVINQFQLKSGVLAHLGDLSTGEPNSRGYTFFENNTVLTSFVSVGTGVYTPIIGAPQTIDAFNNLFSVTTGATTSTTNKMTYIYPLSTGSTITYLKFNVSLSVESAQNQNITFQLQRNRSMVITNIPIGMSVTPTGNGGISVAFNGVADASFNDEFTVVVKNNTGSGVQNSVRITDFSFSMFT